MRQYYAWADVIRITAILLVVLLHTFKVSNENTFSALVSLGLIVLAKVCVPLFIMLSGALLLPKEESFSVFLHKRLKRVVLPWITWTIVFFLLTRLKSVNSPWDILIELKYVFTAYFTFLPLLFCLYLLIPTLRIIVRWGGHTHAWYLVGLWFGAASFLPYFRNSLAFPLSVDNGIVTQTVQFSGYLLAGWLLSLVTLTTKKVLFLIGSVVMGITLWVSWLMKTPDGLNTIHNSYTSPWIIISSMTLFVFLVNVIPRSNVSPTAEKWLQLASRTSFGVFLIHNAINDLITPFLPTESSVSLIYNLSRWLLVSITSFGLILLLFRFKRLRRYVT